MVTHPHRTTPRLGLAILIAIVAVIAAQPAGALAQDSLTRRLERQLQSAEQQYQLRINPALQLTERMMFQYGGRANFGFMAVDDTGQETRILRQTTVQLYGDLNIDGIHQLFGRLRYQYRDFNPGHSFDGSGDATTYPLGDRWWYQLNLHRAIEAHEGKRSEFDLSVKLGRQYIFWGSGLTFADQLYAVSGTFRLDPFRLEAFAGVTPESSVIDFDSSRPSFDGDTNRLFVGGRVTYTGLDNHDPYAFVLTQEDQNDENFAVIGAAPPIAARFEYDSTYIGVGSTGKLMPRLLYTAEFVYEMGQGLSDPIDPAFPVARPQALEDVEAWAALLNLSYLFRDPHLSRVDFTSVFASGDDDRLLDTSNTFGGNLTGSKDRSFNAFGYVPSGQAFGAPLSNLMMFRVGASTFPLREQEMFKRLQVGIDVFIFNKMDRNAPLDEATNASRYLGFETDVYANWRILSDVALNLRYGVFFPGEGIRADKDERHFLFAGITYSF